MKMNTYKFPNIKGSWPPDYYLLSPHVDPRSADDVWCQHPDLPGGDGWSGGGDGVGPHLRPPDSHWPLCLGCRLLPLDRVRQLPV